MSEYKLPEPYCAVCVMVSAVGSTHMTPKGDYYGAHHVLQAYQAGRDDALEQAAQYFETMADTVILGADVADILRK